MDIVSFIFIDAKPGESRNVASKVAQYELAPEYKYVRWTAELAQGDDLPNSVIAAVRVPSEYELNSLKDWIWDKVPGVENVTLTTVPDGVHYSEVPEPHPLNGWP